MKDLSVPSCVAADGGAGGGGAEQDGNGASMGGKNVEGRGRNRGRHTHDRPDSAASQYRGDIHTKATFTPSMNALDVRACAPCSVCNRPDLHSVDGKVRRTRQSAIQTMVLRAALRITGTIKAT